MKNKDLAVVCCYFNHGNYKTKLDNFINYYSHVSSYIDKVLTIELVSDDSIYTLPKEVNSIKYHSNAKLWHKENLLNLGINQLIEEGYEYIAWLDADIIFQDSFWVEEALYQLQNYNLCQLFSRSIKQHIDGHETFHPGCARYWQDSGNILPINRFYHTGYAWASTASCLKQCQLYDKSIIGGADSLIWLASLSNNKSLFELMTQHPLGKLELNSYLMDYFDWAEKWSSVIQSKVSCLYSQIKSLAHGQTKNKKYISRYQILKDEEYNPKLDIYYENKLINIKNKNLEKLIKNYFNEINEDETHWLGRLNKFIDKSLKKQEIKARQKNFEKGF